MQKVQSRVNNNEIREPLLNNLESRYLRKHRGSSILTMEGNPVKEKNQDNVNQEQRVGPGVGQIRQKEERIQQSVAERQKHITRQKEPKYKRRQTPRGLCVI